jgi:hypothetical protein
LLAVNNQLHGMDPKRADVLELVPDGVIRADAEFMQYMRDSNEQLGDDLYDLLISAFDLDQ